MRGSVLQKTAWDSNAIRCTPLYTSIEPPRSSEVRARGEFGFGEFFQNESAKMHIDGQRMPKSFLFAKEMVMASSNTDVSAYVNSNFGER